MTVVSRQPDQSIQIGRKLTLTVTDVDSSGVRVLARGECMGGAEDGALIDRAFELGLNGEIALGSLIRVTVVRLATNEARAYLGVHAPAHVEIQRTENSPRE